MSYQSMSATGLRPPCLVVTDVVIALQIDLPTLRRRRGADWPETLYLTQQRRLSSAFSAAAIVLDTAALDAEAALAKAVAALSRPP